MQDLLRQIHAAQERLEAGVGAHGIVEGRADIVRQVGVVLLVALFEPIEGPFRGAGSHAVTIGDASGPRSLVELVPGGSVIREGLLRLSALSRLSL